MMFLDLIILSLIAAAFYGGFKAGNRFKTLREMVDAGLDYFSKPKSK